MPFFYESNSAPLQKHDRADERINENVCVSFFVSPPNEFVTPIASGDTKTLNISRSGMCILLEDSISVPSKIQTSIHFPKLRTVIPMMGKVLWCNWAPENRKYKAGVRFVGRLPEDLGEMCEGQV